MGSRGRRAAKSCDGAERAEQSLLSWGGIGKIRAAGRAARAVTKWTKAAEEPGGNNFDKLCIALSCAIVLKHTGQGREVSSRSTDFLKMLLGSFNSTPKPRLHK